MDKFVKKIGANNGGSDEWYTPESAVKPILQFLNPHSVIWCPFDTKESNYVKVLSKAGHKVIHTHISEGKDFFKCNVKSHIDYIISNPPYSLRNKIFECLYKLCIPFAMLFNSNGLFDSKPRIELTAKYGVELLYLYPRVNFISENGSSFMPPFQSVYLCHNILPEKIMFNIQGINQEHKKYNSETENVVDDIKAEVKSIAERSLNTADRRVCNNVLKIIELRSKGWIYNTSK